MSRALSLVWLIALLAFVVAPMGAVALSHAMAPSTEKGVHDALVDCPDHAPPPADCPAKGTAKHAAGDCCPPMSGTTAVLPSPTTETVSSRIEPPLPAHPPRLRGLTFAQDPPPPRV
jgi:hypothetical protein